VGLGDGSLTIRLFVIPVTFSIAGTPNTVRGVRHILNEPVNPVFRLLDKAVLLSMSELKT
jgi:hypothetical protein